MTESSCFGITTHYIYIYVCVYTCLIHQIFWQNPEIFIRITLGELFRYLNPWSLSAYIDHVTTSLCHCYITSILSSSVEIRHNLISMMLLVYGMTLSHWSIGMQMNGWMLLWLMIRWTSVSLFLNLVESLVESLMESRMVVGSWKVFVFLWMKGMNWSQSVSRRRPSVSSSKH